MTKVDFDLDGYLELEKLLSASRRNYEYGNEDSTYQTKFNDWMMTTDSTNFRCDQLEQVPEHVISFIDREFFSRSYAQTLQDLLAKFRLSRKKPPPPLSEKRAFELLAMLLSPLQMSIEAEIGPFAVTQLELDSTTASSSSKSEGWHFDPAPSNHYKIIIYLADHNDHNGATEYLCKGGSEALIKMGYNNAPPNQRVNDLGSFNLNVDMKTRRQNKKGEVFLFRPSETCHRAIYPTQGVRKTITISLLASENVSDWLPTSKLVYKFGKLSSHPPHARWPLFT